MNIVLDVRSLREWGDGLGDSGFEPSTFPLSADQLPVWSALGGREVASVLSGEGVWDSMHVVGDVGFSQFDAIVGMMRENRDGLRESYAGFAIEGTGFHGNRQRPWQAHAGNIHLSCFRPLDLDASQAACLSMIPTLAVCDAVECFVDATFPRPGIKWINDVYVDGRKLSGALTHTGVIDGRIVGVAYGIGLNVGVAPVGVGDEGVGAAVCMHELCGRESHASAVALKLLERIARQIDRLEAGRGTEIVDDYRERSICIGRHIEIVADASDERERGELVASGRLATIHPDLSLEIDGLSEPVRRGRISRIL